MLDSGIISQPGRDLYYGSIAVNPLGEVVVGFTELGADEFASAYAAAGLLSGNSLTFGSPILLKAGVAPYVAFSQRWGDYSATTYDPTNPSHFWTIQEWASGGTPTGGGQDFHPDHRTDLHPLLPGRDAVTTDGGEVAVEHLKVGDMVRTATGQLRAVRWIGAGKVLTTPGRRNAATPVIVAGVRLQTTCRIMTCGSPRATRCSSTEC